MGTLEKELTPNQIDGWEELGQIKQRLSPERWILFRTLMLTYLNGIEAGISLENSERMQAVLQGKPLEQAGERTETSSESKRDEQLRQLTLKDFAV